MVLGQDGSLQFLSVSLRFSNFLVISTSVVPGCLKYHFVQVPFCLKPFWNSAIYVFTFFFLFSIGFSFLPAFLLSTSF
uniref:Ovule protein n=1 Tax=Meloidogyne incognita TaxID=6306 RepID=A0A914MGF5_MELIC